jgi:hypothetical protein
VSGLIAGFTFLSSNYGIQFFDTPSFTKYQRDNLYGALLIVAFLFSLFGSLMSAVLIGYVNLAGPPLVDKFAATFWYVFDLPMILMMTGIVAMLGAALVLVEGLYSSLVYYIMLGTGGGLLGLLLIAFVSIRHFTHKVVEQQHRGVGPGATRMVMVGRTD